MRVNQTMYIGEYELVFLWYDACGNDQTQEHVKKMEQEK